ncbi:hypothetical protein RUMCAL_01319 [Ruminococcus callidus ATCC 27760]|uniref:Uncharacterized protein n=1 Tax=Ruminococcus callidus ATCC 27760 TaxID=411473 RepID=U2MAI5_9FIRM|nr:hypothetical protein RUMCAL_01319 [Ruminococcus callidus ATCC 27760]
MYYSIKFEKGQAFQTVNLHKLWEIFLEIPQNMPVQIAGCRIFKYIV